MAGFAAIQDLPPALQSVSIGLSGFKSFKVRVI
jgi:hypothetical protein